MSSKKKTPAKKKAPPVAAAATCSPLTVDILKTLKFGLRMHFNGGENYSSRIDGNDEYGLRVETHTDGSPRRNRRMEGKQSTKQQINMTEIQQLIDNVRAWGIAKGITGPEGKATLLTQLSKTQEELTETRDAAVALSMVIKKRQHYRAELKDGIGDVAVTIILAAELAGLRFEDCLQAAYDEIKGRTGRMEGGVFVKDK